MPDAATINALKQELDEKRRKLEEARRETLALEQALALLSGDVMLLAAEDSVLPRNDFRGLSIVDAATRLMEEFGRPLETGVIAKELKKRGLESSSKNWIATVYATLDNSPQVERVGTGRNGKWQPKDKR